MTIFHERWWLDAVAPGRWREATVVVDGELRARWPYLPVSGPLRLRRLVMPPLTPRLGPAMTTRETRLSRQLEEQKRMLLELAEQLPPHDQLVQSFHPSNTYWLPLAWRGFTQTTLYSYTLESLEDLDSVFASFSKGLRSDIRKAARRLEVDPRGRASEMYELTTFSLARSGKKAPFSLDVLERVHAEVVRRGCGILLVARDPAGLAQAGALVVWDETSAYYLLGGVRPEARQSGAASLLLWEALRHVAGRTRMFDFEGSRIESIETYFRSFGGRPVPYSRVEHTGRALGLATALRGALTR